MTETYLSTGQVARRLGISTRTLRRAMQRGEIAAALLTPGGSARFRAADVERYAAGLGARDGLQAAETAPAAMEPALRAAGRRKPRSARHDDSSPTSTRSAVPIGAAGHDVHRHVVELQWLCDVARQVNTARTLGAVLDVVYEAIRHGLGYDRVGINLFDYEAGVFEDRIGTDAQGQVVRPVDRIVGLSPDSPLWRFPGIAALLAGAPFYYTLDAAAECPPELRYLFDGLPAHNLMVSLRAGERVIGMISVDNLLSGRPITPEEARPLLGVADQVGTAVERARAEEALQKERDFTSAVLETAGSLVAVLDRQGRIIRFNRACERTTGYSFAEVQGQPFWDLFLAPEEAAPVKAMFAQLSAGHVPMSYESHWRARDGQRRLIAWSNTALLDAAGQPEHIIATGIDITERKRADEQLRRVYHALRGGVVVLDADGRVLEANAAAEEILGLSLQELRDQPLSQETWTLTRPDGTALPVDERPAPIALRTKRPAQEAMVHFVHAGRSDRWLQIDAAPLLGDDGAVEQVVVSYVDLTLRVQAEEALRESEQRFRMLIETAPVGACVIDEQGVFETANAAYCAIYGYSAEELVGRHFTLTVPPAQRADLARSYQRLLAADTDHQGEYAAVTKEGHALTVLASMVPLAGPDGRPKLATFVLDISERKRTEQHLAHVAHHDVLTGLPNRALLHERLSATLRGAHQDTATLALLLIDLDRFKEVNDTLGHDVGDVLLQHVATRLAGALRPEDTVARLGGDEFAVLLPGTDEPGAIQVAQKLLAVLTEPVVLAAHCLEVGGSLGIAVAPTHGTDAATLLRHADVAMYVAKRGGSGYAVYAPEQDRRGPIRALPGGELDGRLQGGAGTGSAPRLPRREHTAGADQDPGAGPTTLAV